MWVGLQEPAVADAAARQVAAAAPAEAAESANAHLSPRRLRAQLLASGGFRLISGRHVGIPASPAAPAAPAAAPHCSAAEAQHVSHHADGRPRGGSPHEVLDVEQVSGVDVTAVLAANPAAAQPDACVTWACRDTQGDAMCKP